MYATMPMMPANKKRLSDDIPNDARMPAIRMPSTIKMPMEIGEVEKSVSDKKARNIYARVIRMMGFPIDKSDFP
jgi:hypothetical protein